MDNFITANPTQCRVFGDGGGKIDWTNISNENVTDEI